MQNHFSFSVQERNKAKNCLEKDFYNLPNNAFHGETMENLRNNRMIKDLVKKDENDENIEQQSKLTLTGIHKCYTNYDSYTFKQNEVLMEKRISLGFAIWELSELMMIETFYDKSQPVLEKKMFSVIILKWTPFYEALYHKILSKT